MPEMINLYLVEDHEMYLEGLTLLLGRQADMQVIGSSSNGTDFKSALPGLPDLTLMRGTRFIHRLLKYDIQGYLLKSAPVEDLLQAIRTVAKGGTYYSKEIDISGKQDDPRHTVIIDNRKVDDILTRREQEVLSLICREFSNAEIAEKLFLSIGTVETHRKRIISKLGVNNTVGLVKFAVRHGLIDD